MLKRKKVCSLLMVSCLVASMALSGCSGSGKAPAESGGDKKMKVALITGAGGLGDRSFNDSAWAGFQKAEKELGVEIKAIEPATVAEYATSLRTAADGGYDFIMTAGSDWGDTVNELAPKYPNIKFGAINITCELDNVAVAKFSDFESGFMAGALAGLMTETNKVGYIGGMDVPAIQRFEVGYEEGVQYVNPDAEVLDTYVGSFGDPGKGKEFAIQLFSQGADVIYHGAGKSGEGMFDAVKNAEDGCYVIGCDSDQDYIVEGKVLASTLKRVDVASYDFIKMAKEGNFKSGDQIYNLANGGIGFSDMTYTKGKIVSDEVVAKLDEIREDIKNGKIQITDVFQQQ